MSLRFAIGSTKKKRCAIDDMEIILPAGPRRDLKDCEPEKKNLTQGRRIGYSSRGKEKSDYQIITLKPNVSYNNLLFGMSPGWSHLRCESPEDGVNTRVETPPHMRYHD